MCRARRIPPTRIHISAMKSSFPRSVLSMLYCTPSLVLFTVFSTMSRPGTDFVSERVSALLRSPASPFPP
eukprot:6192878-Pleurochrysis_carterae.AAC.1